MTGLNQIFRCDICGNLVEVLHPGDCELVCCQKDMRALQENAVDASLEKHVPVIAKMERGYRVQIGAEKHPMTPEHRIEWIELLVDKMVLRKYLKPGDDPVAEFSVEGEEIAARAFCNLHGLWGAKR